MKKNGFEIAQAVTRFIFFKQGHLKFSATLVVQTVGMFY